MSNKKNMVTCAEIRMYRMGTGDCFIIKFKAEGQSDLKMMIDCGTWSGDQGKLSAYIKELKEYVANEVDVLVVTHEHKDHVYVFEACEELFTHDFKIGQIWMAWTEDETAAKVKQWQLDYADQKKALGKAAKKLKAATESPTLRMQLAGENNGLEMLALRQQIASDVVSFTELQLSADDNGNYIGGLKGMKIVKEKLNTGNIKYFHPGDVIRGMAGLPGIRFFVLGPPENWDQVRKESGKVGESYAHNKMLTASDAFAMAVLHSQDKHRLRNVLPFDESYDYVAGTDASVPASLYSNEESAWRQIDFDWLNSTGALAMRINSITNNLSLALAIEFEESGRVLLFPGDAEYGSWESWHQINWPVQSSNNNKPMVEDLLNRTVFYKVAHHLSHNGTAKKLGMDMMTHPELTAMATLDYSAISSHWKTTMPNRGLLQDLIRKSSGRLIVMNTEGLFYDQANQVPLGDQIRTAREQMTPELRDAFISNLKDETYHFQFTVSGV